MVSDTLSETRVSSGFLTVVPSKVRRAAGIRAGDRLEWTLQGSEIRIQIRKRTSIEDITGLIDRGGDAVSDKRLVQGVRRRVR